MPLGRAKRQSTCPTCKGQVYPGDIIVWGKGSMARHKLCRAQVSVVYGLDCFRCGDHTDLSDYCKRCDVYTNKATETTERYEIDDTADLFESTIEEKETPMPDSDPLAETLSKALLPFIESKIKGKVDLETLKKEISDRFDPFKTDADAMLGTLGTLAAELAAQLEDLKNKTPQVIDVNFGNETRRVEGRTHFQFPVLLKLIALKKNVYLWGSAGGGKTSACRQVAESLGLRFSYISLVLQSQPSALLGFMNLKGDLVRTEFREVWEHGGLFLIDEMDNASGNLLTMLNTCLDSDVCAFPDGLVKKHENAIFIAAGNTVGLGATRAHSSRQKLDAATRERFGFLAWQYDEQLEKEITLDVNPDASKWVAWIQAVRKTVTSLNTELVVSPRASKDGARTLLAFPGDYEFAAEESLFKGIDADTKTKIVGNNPYPKGVN